MKQRYIYNKNFKLWEIFSNEHFLVVPTGGKPARVPVSQMYFMIITDIWDDLCLLHEKVGNPKIVHYLGLVHYFGH